MISVSAEDDLLNEGHCFCVLGVIDDMSLMIISKDVKKIGKELKNLSVCSLQLSCLQTLNTEEQKEKGNDVNTKEGRKNYYS